MPYERSRSANRRGRHMAARRAGLPRHSSARLQGVQLLHQSIPTTMASGSGRAQRAEKAQKSLRAS